ncbi:hypothetical protein G7085_05475 [Tessaracoccus sp. HDW20]|uniref:pilus assembly protein TadG-related protein n=1 Tax=Tessaracoccus coleopterorum TaxID=2714950 RepID=UPI0018D42B5D|nr:hypothetical protein [Tessaracoccus coleopterorum]
MWTAVAMPAFIITVGLGVDFSGHAEAEQEARSIAAEAARAAAHEVIITDGGPRLDVGAARRAGQAFAADAGYRASVEVTGATTARVTISGAYPTIFLGLIGVQTIDFQVASSAAAVSTLNGEEA